jgi:hypothetical protein
MAYDELLARYHRKVLQVADGHMSRYWRRRQAPKDKHTNTMFYEDLVAAGVAAMWKAALKFDLEAGYRFWTAARLPVLGAISDEARLWRRHGSGEGRIDRWLYTHPTASPEQVLAAQQSVGLKRPVFHSLQEAAEGIQQFWAWGADTEVDFDEEVDAVGSFRSMYSCFSQYTLSLQLSIHERFSLVVDRLSGGLDTGPDVGEVSRPKTPREPLDCSETAAVRFKNGKRRVNRQKAASYCYGIVVTPELRARALKDLEFAKERWQRRHVNRKPMPGEQYPRWSTKFGAGRAEHKNKQIVPAYLTDGNPFKWIVRYRGAEGDILSVLESPSRHCLYGVPLGRFYKPKRCEFCEKARSGSRSHNVALQPTSVALQRLPSRRALGCRPAAVDIQPQNSRTKPRTAETRLEQERCQTQFAKLRG